LKINIGKPDARKVVSVEKVTIEHNKGVVEALVTVMFVIVHSHKMFMISNEAIEEIAVEGMGAQSVSG
jgi:hypothetical protein